MPHKRAKRSVRSVEQNKKGSDLAPTNLGFEKDISKRASWILNAEQVRKTFHEKRKRDGEDLGSAGPDGQKKSNKRRKKTTDEEKLPRTILPGESLGHFNKRIEVEFRPEVRAAVKSSSAVTKKQKNAASGSSASTPSSTAKNDKKAVDTPDDTESQAKPTSKPARDPKARKTEFDTLPTKTRLNDIAMAPPTLARATRKTPEKSSAITAGNLGLTMAQKVAMEAEREIVIERYRELKATKNAEAAALAEERKNKGKSKPKK